ncbi:MAG: UbiA prenyltransferase family protein [Candidatus Eisenbacteria bacterium]
MAGPEDLRNPVLRALDFVFILRPTVVVGMWVFFFAGAALAARASGVCLPLFFPPKDVLLGFGAMTAVLGGGCLLNQITDVETDRVNEKLFFLPRGLISTRAAWAELAVVWVLAAALALPLSAGFKLALAASLFLNVTYSAPPLRAKSRCPWDMAWNGLGFGFVSAAAGWAAVSPLTQALVPVGLTYTLAVAGVTASTTVLDVEGDRSEGLRTTAAVLGARGASALSLVLVGAAGVAGALFRDPLGFFGPLLSLPLLVRAHVTRVRSDRIAANQSMVAAFALVASVRAPYLLLLLALVYFGSRGYYRTRFGLSYPGSGTP